MLNPLTLQVGKLGLREGRDMTWVTRAAGGGAGTRLQGLCAPIQCCVPVQGGNGLSSRS